MIQAEEDTAELLMAELTSTNKLAAHFMHKNILWTLNIEGIQDIGLSPA